MKNNYKYDSCSFCGGIVTERRVQKACWWGEKLIAITDNVPAGVCEQCGEKYFRAAVLKQIEKIISGGKKLDKITIPLAKFAASV